MSTATSAPAVARSPVFGWLLVAVLLVALRLPHLTGPIDDPHSWRQCDTVHYSLDFSRRGLDLLHPQVAWLGPHRTLIFELALPEAISALLYRACGPDPIWDRVVTLAFFIAATAYLFAFVRAVASSRVAWLAALAYLALPLGQYYSRAANVDFAATAFAHALLTHGALAIRRRSFAQAALAALAGTLAALIKAPYIVPVLGPLGVAALAAPAPVTVALGALALGIPAIAFKLWRRHVDAVNGAAPDWDFLPGYYKEVNPLWWYVGSWAQRLEPGSWIKLARRGVYEIATPAGAALAALGLWRRGGASTRFGPLAFALAWWAGTFAYLMVFFPLNVIHNYYQIPFLAPTALLVALGADLLWERRPHLGPVPFAPVAFGLFLALAAVMPRALGYYRVDWLRVEAGRLIRERVPADDLIVVSDYAAQYSDPRLLVRADRLGWPLAMRDLARERLDRLAALGARWVAVVTDPGHPDLAPPAFLEPDQVVREPIAHAGTTLGTLTLYRLTTRPQGGAAAGGR